MGTVDEWLELAANHGSDFTYVREGGDVPCPCRTEQGFRDDVWHKTDLPVATTLVAAGNITGDFRYTVRFNYAQGEKWSPEIQVPLTNERLTLFWGAPLDNPPGGQGPAISVRIYRKRSGGSWLLVTEITDLTVLEYTDNTNADTFPAQNPIAAICNQAGFITDNEISFDAKGFIHPVQSGAVRRLTTEFLAEMFGEVKADDHVGLVPCTWNGKTLNFKNWSETTKDRIIYNQDSYTVVSYNLIPCPDTGDPYHHWEIGLRLVEIG